MENSKWSLKKKDSGQVYKDLDFSTVKKWILEARIEADDYVANSQIKKWVKASSLEVLKSHFSPETSGSEVISSRDVTFGWNQDDNEEDSNIDLTSMIDVTFLLLIFFMVTATFTVHEIMGIQVPPAKNTQQQKDKKITVSIDKQQKIYVNKIEVQLNRLKDTLMQKTAETAQQDVLLAADHKLDWGFIVQVLDEIQGSGVKDVKLKLEKKK